MIYLTMLSLAQATYHAMIGETVVVYFQVLNWFLS
jgi:hypothetical protein